MELPIFLVRDGVVVAHDSMAAAEDAVSRDSASFQAWDASGQRLRIEPAVQYRFRIEPLAPSVFDPERLRMMLIDALFPDIRTPEDDDLSLGEAVKRAHEVFGSRPEEERGNTADAVGHAAMVLGPEVLGKIIDELC